MIPKYLFHYTSFEGIKNIISSRNIRFTRIDKLNDPFDGHIASPHFPDHINELRKTVYVSCWSDLEEESIPLWDLYKKMEGVRVKIRTSLFSKKTSLTEFSNFFVLANSIAEIKLALPIEGIENAPINNVYGPIKIIYSDTLEKTYSDVVINKVTNDRTSNEFELFKIEFKELGLKKLHYWSFENEWRYKIDLFGGLFARRSAFENKIDFLDMPEYIDVPYNSDVLSDMEIISAPKANKTDIDKLKQYLTEEHLNCIVKQSDIQYNG